MSQYFDKLYDYVIALLDVIFSIDGIFTPVFVLLAIQLIIMGLWYMIKGLR